MKYQSNCDFSFKNNFKAIFIIDWIHTLFGYICSADIVHFCNTGVMKKANLMKELLNILH